MTHDRQTVVALAVLLALPFAACAADAATQPVPSGAPVDPPRPALMVRAPETTVDPVPAAGPVVSGATPAVRQYNAYQATDTLPPPPQPTGLNGLPLPPVELGGCALMEWHADQVGLPADFDWIGWEESNCRNDVSTWCCYGYWQVHELHIGERSAAECDVDEPGDYYGANPLDRQRNACMAALVYVRQGVCAWDVVKC